MNLAHWLMRMAQRDGTRAAFFVGRDCVADYAKFAADAQAVAGWLRQEGYREGDRIALFMPNEPEYLVALFGIWQMGGVAVPINAKLHPKEAAWICGNCDARLVFSTGPLAEGAREVGLPVADPGHARAAPWHETAHRGLDDLAWLFYTSGTTGRPKGVEITHGMVISLSQSYAADIEQVQPEDATLYAAPVSHGAGTYSMMHVLAGARHIFPPSKGFDPAEIFDLAAYHGRVHMFAAPTMVTRMTRHARETGAKGTGLRTVIYAGGPMYLNDILEATETFGDIFAQIYGQGECPMAITVLPRRDVMDRAHPDWQARLASVGFAQSGVDVRILDADGNEVPRGDVGEIAVRGAPVMRAYWNNPEATAKTLKDGWLWTGDLGHMDEAGYVTMVDRSKDMIITGGSNVYPREVEEVLLTHDQITEVAVVGRPHADWGEEVVAFYVAERALEDVELDALCNAHIARFKRPKAYLRLSELPKNNYGKVLKTDLRARFSQA